MTGRIGVRTQRASALRVAIFSPVKACPADMYNFFFHSVQVHSRTSVTRGRRVSAAYGVRKLARQAGYTGTHGVVRSLRRHGFNCCGFREGWNSNSWRQTAGKTATRRNHQRARISRPYDGLPLVAATLRRLTYFPHAVAATPVLAHSVAEHLFP